jgi:hypothetical protein
MRLFAAIAGALAGLVGVSRADPASIPTVVGSGGGIVASQNAAGTLVDPALEVSGDDFIGARVVLDNRQSGDVLSFTAAALPTGVTGSYNTSTGVLAFTGTATSPEWQVLLRTIAFSTTSSVASQRSITITLGTSIPFEENGHFYEFVTAPAITWTDAKVAAEARDLFGLQGYLVTVTSATEGSFVVGKLAGQGWMGASDAAQESIWRWVTGPEGLEDTGQGRHFFTQTSAASNSGSRFSTYGGALSGGGNAIGGEYDNWAASEPNDYGASGEDYAHFLLGGQWNDYPVSLGGISGYVVEYGGMPGDPVINITATRTVDVNLAATILDLSAATVGHSLGADAAVGTLSATDPDGGTFTYTFVAGSGDTHNALFTIDGATLRVVDPAVMATGDYSVRIQATDEGGALYSRSFTISVVDDIPPSAPVVNGAPVLGAVSGTAEPGATVEVFVDGVSVGTTVADGNGDWSLALDPATFAAGAHTITAAATDAAGNTGVASTGQAFTSVAADQILAPAPGVIRAGTPISYSIVFDGSVTVDTSGGTPRIPLQIGGQTVYAEYASGSGTDTLVFTYVVQAGDSGATVAIGSPIDPHGGSIVDAGGNNVVLAFTAPAPVSLAVDTAPPTPATVLDPVDDLLGGTAEAGSTVRVYVDGVLVGTTTADGTGAWSYTIDSSALEGGTRTVTTTVTDAAGNVSTASAAVDLIVRVAQTITFPTVADKSTTDTPFTLGASASGGGTIVYSVVSGPATVTGDVVTLTGAPGVVTIAADQTGGTYHFAAPRVTTSFAVVAPYPPTWFGDIEDGDGVIGAFAAQLAPDGSGGTILVNLPGSDEAFVVLFTTDADGNFTATIVSGENNYIFSGRVEGGAIGGTISPLGATFGGAMEPVAGPHASSSGYYTADALDTSTAKLHTIVGTSGKVMVLSVGAGGSDAASGELDGTSGEFSVVSDSGVGYTGLLDPVAKTLEAALVTNDGFVQFAGLASGTPRTDRLTNLSSRSWVGTGEDVLIAGFVVSGTEPKSVLVRAVGPGMANFGLSDTLANPRITVRRDGVVVGSNDDWSEGQNAGAVTRAIFETGAFSLAAFSKDAAELLVLEPGHYTATVEGIGSEGVALAEIYDASGDPGAEAQRLVNISTRGAVRDGEGALIGGFVVTGNAPKRVLVRGVGPGLAQHGIVRVLENPVLRIYDAGTVVAQNDDWGNGANSASEIAEAAEATGAFALGTESLDAAVVVTLAPGAYTAVVTGADGSTGVALVEIYQLDD